jgi:hypothetical protein
MQIIGKVKYIALEGGFYGIIAEDGQQYYPVNMPQQYKADGTSVRCIVTILKDAATLAMWGVPVRITSFHT